MDNTYDTFYDYRYLLKKKKIVFSLSKCNEKNITQDNHIVAVLSLSYIDINTYGQEQKYPIYNFFHNDVIQPVFVDLSFFQTLS